MSNIELLNRFKIKRKEHTHRMVIDMLTKEFRVKTIEVLFNANEYWTESDIGAANIGGMLLSKFTKMLSEDKETIAWKATAYDVKSGAMIVNWLPQQNEIIIKN